jgi:hypothetical protein
MSTKPLTLKGVIDVEDENEELLRQWRREKQQLEDEARALRTELENERAEREKLQRSIVILRRQLGPLHHALRAVFGEIEIAVGEEEPMPARTAGSPAQSSNSTNPDRWNAIKGRLTKKQSELVDVLLLQGGMNRTQCAKAIKSDYTFCRKSVIAPLLAQGLLIEGGDGLLELKQL